jgi:hypothetical protein
MDDGLPPEVPRLLRLILPARFVARVVEPAYNDLLASSIERGHTGVGFLASARFVLGCLWTAFPHSILGSRRSKVLAAGLAATITVLIVVRLRMDYGTRSSPQPPPRFERSRSSQTMR